MTLQVSPLSPSSTPPAVTKPAKSSRRKTSLVRGFWTTSSANHFSSSSSSPCIAADHGNTKSTSNNLPPGNPSSGAYIPRHAAADFSKHTTTRRSRRRQTPLPSSIPTPMLLSGDEHDEDATLCSFDKDRVWRVKRRSRTTTTTATPPTSLETRTVVTRPEHGAAPAGNDYAVFLAEAERRERLRHVLECPGSGQRKSPVVVVSQADGKRKQKRLLTRRIWEYIRPKTAVKS